MINERAEKMSIPDNALTCWQCGAWLTEQDTKDGAGGLCNYCYDE